MNVNKLWSVFVFAALFSSIDLSAQTLSSVLFQDNRTKFVGQHGRHNTKTRNGMGIGVYDVTNLFIGDWQRNHPTGYGMMLAESGEISYCPSALFYVGDIINGKKEGYGVAYNAAGNIIYEGAFENDMPVAAYPQTDARQTSHFSMIPLVKETYYIGESKNGIPDGFGLQTLPSGDLWFGLFVAGHKEGVGMLVVNKDNWKVVDIKGQELAVIESSELVEQRKKVFKKAQAEYRQGTREEFYDLMTDVSQFAVSSAAQIHEMKHGSSAGAGASVSDDDSEGGYTSSSSKKKGGKKKPAIPQKKNNGTAWMTDKRTYSDYETQLIKGKSDGMSPDEQREIRRKMKAIRTKWESRGEQFTKSIYE